jgi:putative colanic acid biosynthesis UDP-glucose lipid carrier transferase
MTSIKKGYSYLIRPLFLLIDIFIINTVIFYVSDNEYLNPRFLLYINILWMALSYYIGFYKIYRFTNIFRIFSLLAVQFLLFFLIFFAYFGIFKEGQVVNNQFLTFVSIFIGVSILKFVTFFALKWYRGLGRNYRNVVVIGMDDTTKKIIKLFGEKANLGYRYYGFFSDQPYKDKRQLGKFDDSFDYILNHGIDEVYCTLSKVSESQVKELTKFTNKHSLILKLIPESTDLYSKNYKAEYYNNTLVLNVNKLPFDYPHNKIIKRIFDIVFSILIVILVLSWLIPIMWILIKLESRGPLFFKQEREGLKGSNFKCYKFRSMYVNNLSDKIHATKGDERITNIGAFLRKTSIDELPQFFNVLKGDMSIVGPRPHMQSLSLEYQKEIDNYLERHAVKPGITGLAQVSGYRGEVKKRSDIKNRVRFDIFYIENWSFMLDLKIIIQTVLNVFKGEEKAY